jgi:hypothetical protein
MIQKFPYSFEKQLEVQRWPDPKDIVFDIFAKTITVTTGSDLPLPPSAQDQIIALETDLGRKQREAWLASFVPVTDSDKAEYARVKAVDAQIAELRRQL